MRKTPDHIVQEIGRLADCGHTPPQIAEKLGLSIPTVRTILAQSFDIMPEIRRVMENIRVPWKYKKMELGDEEILGTREMVLTAIDLAKKLNDALFKDPYNRRWVVVVNKEMNIVSIKRVN